MHEKMKRLERIKVASIVITTAETFDPHFVFSAHRPNAAAIKSIAQRSQCWLEEIRVESPNNIVGFIRGAIVLQKMKEDDKAIEIFDYVIENYFDKIDTKIKI